MKTRSKPTILDAARALSEVCDGAAAKDGQGFNGADSPFVKSILEQAYLTSKQLIALHKTLAKYGGQLARHGFAYSELVVPAPGPVPGMQQAEIPVPPVAPIFAAGPAVSPWTMSAVELVQNFPDGMIPRTKQLDALGAINEAFRSGKRAVVLEMPTGGGKSPICLTAARAIRSTGNKTHFITIQRALQDQYTKDFPSPEIEVVKGRSNYACTVDPERNCANAPCTDKKKGILPECVVGGGETNVRKLAVSLQLHPDKHLCPYWKNLQICSDSPVTLFNFSSFLFQRRIGRFSPRELLIIDECHSIEQQLMSFVTLELTEYALSVLNIKIDREVHTKQDLLDFIREKDILTKIEEVVGYEGKFGDEDSWEADLDQAEMEAVKELAMKLESFLRYVDKGEWIFETVRYNDRRGDPTKKILARPLYAKDFAEDLLFSNGKRLLFMSATILDVKLWAENLGLDPATIGHVVTPCDFPTANRPIHLEYCGNVGSKFYSPDVNPKDPTQPKFLKKIAQILDRHKGQRGLIHCHSNQLSRDIFQGVDTDRFLFQDHFNGDKKAMMEEHARRTDSVIVAPAMAEGFDFKDDLARFQIIAKIPWPSLGDRVIKERAAKNPAYYGWLCSLKLVQSYGRSVRCFDLDTEILTTGGWKTHDTLKVGDVSFGVDPKSLDGKPGRRPMRWGRVSVIPNTVLAVNRPEIPEPTIHIKTNAVDIVVTADHTMLAQVRSTSTYKQITRRNGHEWTRSVPHTNKSIGLTSVPAGRLPSRFKLPCAGWIKNRKETKHSNDWFWLMGFIIGDGHISKSKNHVAIFQSTAESQRDHVIALNRVLQRLNIKYRYYEAREAGTCFGYERNGKAGVWAINNFDSSRIRDMFHRGEIRRYSKLKAFRHKTHKGVDGWKDVEKRIPRWVLNRATPSEMLHLLTGMMAADGSTTSTSKRSPTHVNGTYWTSDRVLADQLQELLAICGYRSSITLHRPAGPRSKDQWCVLFNNPATSDVDRKASVRPGPTTRVWCPSTELGSVIARRHGKTFVAGNSKTDWGYTYIIDQGFEGFCMRNGNFLPKWFREAFRNGAPREIRQV